MMKYLKLYEDIVPFKEEWDEEEFYFDEDAFSNELDKKIFDGVVRILYSKFGIPKDEVKLNTDICADLGLDSLDHVEFIMEMENVFHISLPDDEVENCIKISCIVNLCTFARSKSL